MEISSDKRKILVNSIKPRPFTNMNGNTLEDVDQFRYPGSTQTKDVTSVKTVKLRPVQAHSAITRLAKLWNQEAHHEEGPGKMPRHFVLRCCRYHSVEKFEDAFNIALGLMQTKPLDAAFSTVFLTSINADRTWL